MILSSWTEILLERKPDRNQGAHIYKASFYHGPLRVFKAKSTVWRFDHKAHYMKMKD